ncbi:hypothetical protein JVT61DRAFT_9136 [Boletus reticuloceps]|uniref:Uncharacterized protein n=1 Tax=Boletus reticuloceps TaxID=495285 RepID=A0A8I3A617_9AGAM|nr:hypothetical protein JVT61DRAFT_9459 [Boletus reticuloceps]KAG6371781.1 hypothetical protein JVT61DRAFT_9136 [Boletus reticuloceps]
MSIHTLSNIVFDKWSTLAVLSKNAPYIPRPVSDDEHPFPRADGSWGPHEISLLPQVYDPEHPYLGHILVEGHHHFRLPQSICCHRLRDSDFYRYPPLPRRGYIKYSVTSVWRDEVDSYRPWVLELYEELRTPHRSWTCRGHPLHAPPHNFMSYRDAAKYTRALQRFIAEIHAFLIWGNNVLGRSLKESDPPTQCFRGVYVSSLADFNHCSALAVPVFYLTPSAVSDLPDSRWVRLTELNTLCEFRTWTDVHVIGCSRDVVRGHLLHSKPLMFYPPHVDRSDPLAFERAARGYASRLDKQRFDKRILADAATLFKQPPQPSLPRKSKPQESDWRRQTKSIRDHWPEWGCDWDYIWHYHATGDDGLPEYTAPDHPVPSHGAHFAYTIPPIHLLANVLSDEKRAKVCFTWVCIRRIWLLRYQDDRLNHPSHVVVTTNNNTPPSLVHLHTQAWRDVLSGQWWRKHCWPTQSSCDHRVFWRHGGALLLGPSQEELQGEQDDSTSAYYSLVDDLSPLLGLGRRLELKDFDNKDLCNLLVYDLSLLNHKLQFEETDDHVTHIDSMSPHDRHARLEARRDLFRSSWDIPDGSQLRTGRQLFHGMHAFVLFSHRGLASLTATTSIGTRICRPWVSGPLQTSVVGSLHFIVVR